MIGPTEILILAVVIGVGVLGTLFWVWMLVDCLKRTTLSTNEKLVWAVVIALTHFVVAAIYFLMGRKGSMTLERS